MSGLLVGIQYSVNIALVVCYYVPTGGLWQKQADNCFRIFQCAETLRRMSLCGIHVSVMSRHLQTTERLLVETRTEFCFYWRQYKIVFLTPVGASKQSSQQNVFSKRAIHHMWNHKVLLSQRSCSHKNKQKNVCKDKALDISGHN